MLAYLRRRAMLNGVLGGSRAWTVAWVVIAVGGVARRVLSDKPEIVYSEELQPGDALIIKTEDLQPGK